MLIHAAVQGCSTVGKKESGATRLRLMAKAFRLMTAMLCLLATALVFPVMAAQPGASSNAPLPSPEKLGGPERALVFLATDKPIYKPGETVYARAVLLRADTFFPLRNAQAPVLLTITGPRKDKLATLSAPVADSTAGFSWTIPATMPGGLYEAEAAMSQGPLAVRKFEVRVYAPPRLKSQIEFLREGYGPGDTVTASINIKRAEGGVPAQARLTAVARVDGVEAARVENLAVDAEGNCSVSFTLPSAIEKGEGSLTFAIEDGGVVETAAKTIPILLQTMDIAFYPEGGELVAGVPGRVYAQARRPDGKPADIQGEILRLDANGKPAQDARPVAELKTAHEGRGLTEFTPAPKERYALRLLQPSGITRLFPLPETRPSGVALRSLAETFAFDEPVKLSVRASQDSGAARLTLFHREKMVAEAALKPGENTVSLTPGEAEGVLMATVWDATGKPLAERLIFRKPKFALRIGLKMETIPAGQSFTPGGKVRLTVETRDEKGSPVEAVVGVSVTDDALLEMTEKRDQAPGLPVMVYLENEVQDLADAQVYFDPQNPDAARDVDLLLGTQGWRRFILVRLDDLLRDEGQKDAARRALAVYFPPPPVPKGVRFERFRVEEGIARNDMRVQKQFEAENAQPVPPVQEAPAAPDEAQAAGVMPAPAMNEVVQVQDDRVAAQPLPQDKRQVRQAPLVSVREYAHQVRPNRKPNDRSDFSETLYWNAGVRTNPRDGTASVEFGLSDSVTTFKARADGFGNNGALGQAVAELASLEPFHLSPKLPPVIVAGDIIESPAVLVNATGNALERIGLIVKAEGLKSSLSGLPSSLAPDSRIRAMLRLEPGKAGAYSVTLNAAAGPYADTVTRQLTVLPRGFPVERTASGVVGPAKPFSGKFMLAQDIEPGSIRAVAKVFPTPLANMEDALNALLRKPHGCFEQTSSTSYPLVMAQQYFMSHAGVSPERIKKASALLEESYKKLVGFESPQKGYEWFGGNPGHEALTAYGLMQFNEMKEVMPVDGGMLDRTRAWLMSRRDGKGGFERNPKALDSFGAAPIPLTNLYILWTLLESGEKPESLQAEIAAAKKMVAETKDPYLLALGANTLFLAGDRAAAQTAAASLQKVQSKDGGLPGAETSITRSGGEALGIETVSLAVLAWLRLGDDYAGSVEQAMAWLFERCKAGRFGSTQSTILALKAINAYDAARAKPKASGTLQLTIDGKPFGKPVAFDKNTQGALELLDFSAALSPGEHSLGLVMTGGGEMPFSIEVAYNTSQPASSPECPLRLTTSLSAREVREGEPVDLALTVTAGEADVPMPLAVIGLPAGLEPAHERLKELVKAERIAAYEIRGRELVLYWRAMKAGSRTEVSVPLSADIPGTYTAPASRVYAFYLDEHQQWVAGEKVVIRPR